MSNGQLTPVQSAMVSTWEQHMAAEFERKSVDETMSTMSASPTVNHVPVMTGGVGREEVRDFYGSFFIGYHAPDLTIVPVARTVGAERIVDEIIYKSVRTRSRCRGCSPA